MTQAVAEKVDLEQYVDKKVLVTVPNPDNADEAIELEGTVTAANDLAVLLKIKGKSQVEMIEAENVLGIALAPEKDKSVSKKHIQPITLGQARQHLADRHGIKLSELKNYTEDSAFAAHAQIDHSDLGHDHKPKAKPDVKPDSSNTESGTTDQASAPEGDSE